MFAFEKLHHVATPANDFSRLHAFYTRVLGLQAHPEKPNWLRAGDGFNVHLMISEAKSGPARVKQHYALQVDSLHDHLGHLLNEHLELWQASLDGQVHPVVDPNDPLEFGLGSLFILDPENNVIEFVQRDKGFFATISR